MKLTIEIPEQFAKGLKDSGLDDVQAALLIRDALGEFIDTRHPVDKYLEKRYASHTNPFVNGKYAEVLKRITWATFIKAGEVKLEP